MTVTNTKTVNSETDAFVKVIDDAGGGTSKYFYVGDMVRKTVQRVSGTGTYTVTGSNDGITFGALNTAIAAIATTNVIPIPENVAYLKVDIAAAPATVVVFGSR